jgi:hypothetical protein
VIARVEGEGEELCGVPVMFLSLSLSLNVVFPFFKNLLLDVVVVTCITCDKITQN